MTIQTTDAFGLYTQKVIDAYKEETSTSKFLASFFPALPPTSALEIGIAVRRGSKKIAVDVVRGTDGNRNTFGRMTQKLFIPPYFREYFDQTSLDHYEKMNSVSSVDIGVFAQFVMDSAEKMRELVNKIDRTYEKYRADILQTGILTFSAGAGQIDFKRKAGSLVDLTSSGGYWATNNDLYAQLQAGAEWLRTNGKVNDFRFSVILGATAMTHLKKNTVFLANQNLFNLRLDNIQTPQARAEGGVFHGTLTAGAYMFDLWTYPEQYEDDAGVSHPYIDAKYGIMLPQNPHFRMAFAGVPQLVGSGQPLVGDYIFTEYVDEKKRTREYHVESAGMPVPTAIDQIYTFKAVA
jgi:hypothetical protein